MSLLSLIANLFIGPLKLVFETIFCIAYYFTGNPGLSIVALSLVMNILVLPLYRQADAMQERARDTDARLRKGVAHIKKTFSGDERMMILQTYYRQNNYRPTDALNGSVSLLLEIPFFMAAYQFLSHAQVLNGAVLGPIQNLGAPDGLLVVGGVALNLLPIAMTAVNCISSALYLKGFPLKTKIQLYGMAMFFLVFLYDSPAGLVFYWTLNNLFSLVKNIFYKLQNPRKVLRILGGLLGAMVAVFGLFFYPTSMARKGMLAVAGMALMLPLLRSLFRSRRPRGASKEDSTLHSDRRIFLLGGLFLAVLTGMLIPSAVIVSSPQEFVDVGYFFHPLWFVASATSLAAGTFLIWMGVFYWLADDRWKVRFQRLMWVLCGVMLMDYLFFATNTDTLYSNLQYTVPLVFTGKEKLLNLAAVLAVGVILYVVVCKFSRQVVPILLTGLIAVGCMSGYNMLKIKQSIDKIEINSYDTKLEIPMSKSGKNVVVLMLDRAMGEYIPYLFNEKPELQEQFDGFTYYPNTISFGGRTNFSTPSLFGGYEYTPVELNKRAEESLAEKHNEALKVMPSLFAGSGTQVTVCDPVYASYQWIPDLSIYDDIPGVRACTTEGMFVQWEEQERFITANCRNFFAYSIMKTAPLAVQKFIYNEGTYNETNMGVGAYSSGNIWQIQITQSPSTATGLSVDFMAAYHVLQQLPELTTVQESGNTFLMMVNDTTHAPVLLQEPEYAPSENVDNTEYDAANKERFTVNGRTILMETEQQMMHYETNMAAMLRLADWFDSLRENGVYDNTRIILVSDHGRELEHFPDMVTKLPYIRDDREDYLPLLMVKDFDSHGFTTSEEFMTDADVPTLAMAGMVENPVNPFTGKAINSDEKQAHEQFVILSQEYDISRNNGNTFLPSYWASVKGNPWERDNWTYYDKECVLDRHAAP